MQMQVHPSEFQCHHWGQEVFAVKELWLKSERSSSMPKQGLFQPEHLESRTFLFEDEREIVQQSPFESLPHY